MENRPNIQIDPTVVKPAFDRRAHCQQIGSKGGQATVERYGVEYMRTIAKTGFSVYADQHHDGNRAAAAASIQKFSPWKPANRNRHLI